MKDHPQQENPLMLDRMKGENETLGAAVMALFITLLMKALGLNKQAVKMTRRANGFQAKDAMKVLEAGRYGAVVQDLGLNKRSTVDDYRWTLNELGAGQFSIIDNNGQPRTLRVGESAAIDKVLNTVNGRKAVKCMLALRRVAMLDQARLDALRRSLAVDTEEIEEGYAPATKAHRDAFGLEEGDVVRYVSLEGSHIMQGDFKSKQGVQQYTTRQHLNLNAESVVEWFKTSVTALAHYCATCTKNGVRGYQANGKAVPVNWSVPAVVEKTVSAMVAARWGIPEAKTGGNRCPTCDCPRSHLSYNSNVSHLPLLTFDGNDAGLASTDMGAVRAVGFRMAKTTFKVVQGVLKDTHTPEEAMKALMGCQGVRYRENSGDTVWRPARLVPVWFHYPHSDGSHTDRLGLALEPIAHAGGTGELNG